MFHPSILSANLAFIQSLQEDQKGYKRVFCPIREVQLVLLIPWCCSSVLVLNMKVENLIKSSSSLQHLVHTGYFLSCTIQNLLFPYASIIISLPSTFTYNNASMGYPITCLSRFLWYCYGWWARIFIFEFSPTLFSIRWTRFIRFSTKYAYLWYKYKYNVCVVYLFSLIHYACHAMPCYIHACPYPTNLICFCSPPTSEIGWLRIFKGYYFFWHHILVVVILLSFFAK